MKGGHRWPSGLSPETVSPPPPLKFTLRLRMQSAQTPPQPDADPLDQLGNGGLGERLSHPRHTVHQPKSQSKFSDRSVPPFPHVFRLRAILEPSFDNIPL